MPEILSIDAHTSQSTQLGYCLQDFVALCLSETDLGYQITENAAYTKHVIKPDILLGDLETPPCSIHVTASDSRDSFRMKKWRYVCELFQIKKQSQLFLLNQLIPVFFYYNFAPLYSY